MDELVFVRVLHVLGVIFWIGGVAMVTTVLLPILVGMQSASEAMAFFSRFRQRFAAQARFTVLLVGLSGFYMVYALDVWQRFMQWQYWWMHAMVLIWLLFSIMLFGLEPRNRHLSDTSGQKVSAEKFVRLQRKHQILLLLSLITIAGAVAGSHGWLVTAG